MTIPNVLNEWLSKYENKHKRYDFIVKRTKNKRIKKKALKNSCFSKSMVTNLIYIIDDRKKSGIDVK